MEEKYASSRLTDGEPETASPVLREVAVMPGLGEVIGVRAAKAHLSGLLDWVAAGHAVTVTSDGKPKARLVPLDDDSHWKPFKGTVEHLRGMPPWRGGLTAEAHVRADRDARG